MRLTVALLSALIIAACGTAPAARGQSQPQNAASDSVVEYLLTSAAADLHAHGPAPALQFRHVRSGYVVTADGARHYRLCGEFTPARDAGRTEWTPFVTIRTSGYEQYLGVQATQFCKRASTTWDRRDLTSSLQSRLDSLR